MPTTPPPVMGRDVVGTKPETAVAVVALVAQLKVLAVPSEKTARPLSAVERIAVPSFTVVVEGAVISKVPPLAVAVTAPRTRFVLVPLFGVSVIEPPAAPRTKAPSVCVRVCALRPFNSKLPPEIVNGVAAQKPLVRLLLEVSSTSLPPLTVVIPV